MDPNLVIQLWRDIRLERQGCNTEMELHGKEISEQVKLNSYLPTFG